MHPIERRRQVLELLAAGVSRREVCRRLGVSYNSTYRWQERLEPLAGGTAAACFRCSDQQPPAAAYTYLLGQYLGDGHIAPTGRSHVLRIYCCDDYPQIMSEVAAAMVSIADNSVHFAEKIGCTAVSSATRHWLCMIPQHGPGMKHTRPIVLTDWQRDLAGQGPAAPGSGTASL